MKHLYIIKDNLSGCITGSFTAVNLACAVRSLRANVDKLTLNKDLMTLSEWDDSVLYELTEMEDKTFKISNQFKLHDLTQLPEDKDNGKDKESK